MFIYQKEWKPFLFADGIIVYIENSKESTKKKKKKELFEFNKFAEYKMNTPKTIYFCILAISIWKLKKNTT